MSLATVEVPARYYARAGEVLLRMGVDITRILKAARISLERINHPDAMMRLDQVEALVAEAFALTGRTDLALDVGRALKLSSHSLVGYGMLSSPDADYALRLAARFFKLIMPAFRMRYRTRSGFAEIAFTPVLSMSRLCFQFHLETLAVATHWELRELLEGRIPDYDLYYSIPEPPHAARYAEMPEARCHFGWEPTPGLRMVFATDFREHPLALSDPSALKMAEQRCNAMVRTALARGRVSDWVGMMLRESGEGLPTLVELAHTLNLSPRTLDRYLRREGTHYRELARRARLDKACALIATGDMSLTQIAYELGYTDAANFTRAFRRETGLSPSAYRRRLRTA
ncbi:AraC-type DNA-binding protein [Fontimonas thermophila]|uniref:AraC-type DNA-binding protein n=1 Tax=Fontimonas thermophila TaxID=1076937 RepID=A0A1I2I826_9GAMM|nr:AraC family transcriptional regulator [Fontimonas thermophila]SFF37056.1 AraC-type DNA-binding protein [Fontimonas thermophila]